MSFDELRRKFINELSDLIVKNKEDKYLGDRNTKIGRVARLDIDLDFHGKIYPRETEVIIIGRVGTGRFLSTCLLPDNEIVGDVPFNWLNLLNENMRVKSAKNKYRVNFLRKYDPKEGTEVCLEKDIEIKGKKYPKGTKAITVDICNREFIYMGLMLPDEAIIEDIDTGMISFEELSSGIESIEENITGNGER